MEPVREAFDVPITLTIDLRTENWHNGNACRGNVNSDFDFTKPFCSRVQDGQTDRQTGE